MIVLDYACRRGLTLIKVASTIQTAPDRVYARRNYKRIGGDSLGMAITVGRVNYLHNEPFYFDMARRGVDWRDLTPNTMADAIRSGDIDAAPVPILDCFRLGDSIQNVAGFCIASIDRAGSVNLYSTKPIEELGSSRIAVIDDSVTAPKLLEVLLNLKYGI